MLRMRLEYFPYYFTIKYIYNLQHLTVNIPVPFNACVGKKNNNSGNSTKRKRTCCKASSGLYRWLASHCLNNARASVAFKVWYVPGTPKNQFSMGVWFKPQFHTISHSKKLVQHPIDSQPFVSCNGWLFQVPGM